MITAVAAHFLGVHVGEVIPFGLYTQQHGEPAGLRHTERPSSSRGSRPICSGPIQLNNAIVQDHIDRLPTFVFFTPALVKQILADSGIGRGGRYQLRPSSSTTGTPVAAVEREFAQLARPEDCLRFHATAPHRGQGRQDV